MTIKNPIIETYRRALPKGELVCFPLADLDRLGVPFWLLTLYPEQGPTNAGSGFGITDAEALIGAYGELTEVTSANLALPRMRRETGSYTEMVDRFGARGVADPLTLCLEAGSLYTHDRSLQWVACRRYETDEAVYVAVEFVANQNSDVEPGEWLITLITNGLGAGLARDHAISHGLLELVQRDGNSVRFRALAEPVGIELDHIEDAGTRELLARLDAAGVDVAVKLASTDFAMSNLYVVGTDRDEARSERSIHPIAALACGEAAHPDREVALRKALLEFAAARSRVAFSHGSLDAVERVAPAGYLEDYFSRYDLANEEPRALATMRSLYRHTMTEMRLLLADRVTRVDRDVKFSELPTIDDKQVTQDRGALAREVARRITDAGFDILVADYGSYLPERAGEVHAVKVIVPGFEVETMSYDRIGERNARRLIDTGSDLIRVGDVGRGGERVALTTEAEARLGGKVWFDVAAAHRLTEKLYALYREPGRHATALFADHDGAYRRTT